MYENCRPQTSIQLTYGGKIRYCRALLGLLETVQRIFPGTFSEHEVTLVKETITNALKRAEETRDLEIRTLETTISSTDVGGGSSTEHREYNGK
jgi:hypothetical protein